MSDQHRDPWAVARNTPTTDEDIDIHEIMSRQRPGSIVSVPDYTQYHLRLTCLELALTVPDGAPPPPLKEVIERARAYWRFVETGEDLVNE